MRYFDTSALTPLVREEDTTSRMAEFVALLPAGELAVSRWTEVEFASLLARHVRMGAIQGGDAAGLDALFEDVIRQSFVVWSLRDEDYALARRYLRRYETGLRAGDALHLAIAGNRGAEVVYSLDKGMIKAGKALGLPMSRGIGGG